MTTPMRLLLLAAVVVCCVGCDQTTKHIARAELRGRPPASYLGDVVQLYYAENPGAFLSLGADLPEPARSVLFVGLSVVIVALLLGFALVSRSLRPAHVVCLGLAAAGGIGNLIDRIAYGSARDFIVIRAGPLHTGVFNIADAAITLGILALLALFALRPAPHPPEVTH